MGRLGLGDNGGENHRDAGHGRSTEIHDETVVILVFPGPDREIDDESRELLNQMCHVFTLHTQYSTLIPLCQFGPKMAI